MSSLHHAAGRVHFDSGQPPVKAIFFGRVFPLVFIVVGIAVLYIGLNRFEQAKQSSSWPTVEGVITRSEVDTQRDSEGGMTYHADISYKYSIDEAVFSSTQIAFGSYGASDRSHAADIVGSYPVGKKVTVYHKVNEPTIAVLESGVTASTYFLPTFGAVFLLVGLVLALLLPKQLRKQQRRQRLKH